MSDKMEFEKYPELTEVIQWFASNVPVDTFMWSKLLSEINKALALHPSESAGVNSAVWVKAEGKKLANGVYNIKADDGIVVMKGVALAHNGEITLVTFLNKTTWGAEELAFNYDKIFYLDESPAAAQSDEHLHQPLFDQYRVIKDKIGKLGYNTFINSKEVEEYREWLRSYRYKHRIEWFEKEYPNGLYSKDDDGELFGINIMTKKFLAEADAAYEVAAAQSGKEEAVAFVEWINHNTKGYDNISHMWVVNDDEDRVTIHKLYDIFKSQNK